MVRQDAAARAGEYAIMLEALIERLDGSNLAGPVARGYLQGALDAFVALADDGPFAPPDLQERPQHRSH